MDFLRWKEKSGTVFISTFLDRYIGAGLATTRVRAHSSCITLESYGIVFANLGAKLTTKSILWNLFEVI
jgi:hypothetical protein